MSVPGLDERTGIWYDPDPTLKLLPVARHPSSEHVASAYRYLARGFLEEVPFHASLDRSLALGALIAPFMRGVYRVPPSFVITSGTGDYWAHALAQMLAVAVTGDPSLVHPSPITVGAELGTAAAEGLGLVVVDRPRRGADWKRCQEIIGSETWTPDGRVAVNWPVWICVSGEDCDESLYEACAAQILLDRPSSPPAAPDPIEFALEHRPLVVHAVLTLIAHWIDLGSDALGDNPWESVELSADMCAQRADA